MLEDHAMLFKEFKLVHANFVLDPQKHQDEFNRLGADVVDIIRDYEDRLCRHSEKGQYGKYSHKLAEKFQDQVRELFPKIDDVGIVKEYVQTPLEKTLDNLKKTPLTGK